MPHYSIIKNKAKERFNVNNIQTPHISPIFVFVVFLLSLFSRTSLLPSIHISGNLNFSQVPQLIAYYVSYTRRRSPRVGVHITRAIYLRGVCMIRPKRDRRKGVNRSTQNQTSFKRRGNKSIILYIDRSIIDQKSIAIGENQPRWRKKALFLETHLITVKRKMAALS